VINQQHAIILAQIQVLVPFQEQIKKGCVHSDSYIQSGHSYYLLPVPIRRHIAKRWAKEHATIPFEEFIALIESLFSGESHEEKTVACMLLEYMPGLRKQVEPIMLDHWLDHLQGWAEVDSLCQSTFIPGDIVTNWVKWSHAIQSFAHNPNICKRRASLVLLTGVVAHSKDIRAMQLAFANIQTLETERDILITKAISWLLRSLIKYHRQEVLTYIEEHQKVLPKIALRETKHVLLYGKKTK
jgi:3-methyladenine DNA glycosylase AlkD